MTPEALAALHARCFDAAPRPWSLRDFENLLDDPLTLLVTGDGGFALGRVIAPEAELLTLAVAPARRRQGLGRALVARLEAGAAARGATVMFLEVAATNAPARALYAGLGYAQDGRRRGYYGPGVDALVLRRCLDGRGGPRKNHLTGLGA